jgi:murein DD-endopeptidase MepM/ murein hydrolase activator NlpD
VEPAPVEAVPEPAAGSAATDDDDDDVAPRGRHRLSAPPRRRGLLWLLALVVGGALAALPTFSSLGPTVPQADYALGNDVDVSGDMGDADVRASITEAEAQLRLGELAASRASREPKTVLPAHGNMSTCFCMRWGKFHYGIDLAAPLGTPIYAAVDGVVLRAGPATGYGNAIWIQDTDGNVEVYGHMRYYSVKAGQVVHAGDQIAKVGSEGESTGPHLHFQIDRGSMFGKPVDPLPWLEARGVSVPGA